MANLEGATCSTESSTASANNCSSCTFCKLSAKQQDADVNKQTTYFHYDEEMFVIADIRPATKHHYLVVSRYHIKNAKQLGKKDVEFLRKMMRVGVQVLTKQLGEDATIQSTELRLGFHWPPFHFVDHLHLHVIYPASQMSFLARSVLYNPLLKFEFVTADWLLSHLEQLPDAESSRSAAL